MKTLFQNGTNSSIEITNISRFGFWLIVNGQELFLPFEKFPWFADATVKQIFNVRKISENHLYWNDLDIDLTIDMIKNPDKYPLIAKNK